VLDGFAITNIAQNQIPKEITMPRHNLRTRRLSNFSIAAIALIGTLSIFGCGKMGGGANSIHVKSASTGEKDLPVKSSYAFAVTKTFTDINSKITTASAHNVYAANYDLDANNFAMTMDRPLSSDDQVRVVFSLIGEEGTNDKSPPKAGTYSAKADKYMKVESVGLVTRKGGADVKSWLDRSMLGGEVKVSSATADEISGDLDLTSGDTSIKGSFTAKVLKRK
jgi:hypothetical protein